MFLRKICIYLQVYTALQPRRPSPLVYTFLRPPFCPVSSLLGKNILLNTLENSQPMNSLTGEAMFYAHIQRLKL